MAHLKLRQPEQRRDGDPIPFPDISRYAGSARRAPADLRIVGEVEDALERVQRDLDELAGEIDRPYRLPGADDDWPSPAA